MHRMLWACLYPRIWGGGDNHPGNGCCMLSRFSHAQLFVTLWTIAQQAPLSVGFSRQEYWSG